MLLPYLTLFDLKALFANYMPTTMIDHRNRSEDFVILVPIFKSTHVLTNIEFLRNYRGRVALCTTDQETEQFYDELQSIADENGFEVIKCSMEGVTNPWQIYQRTLLSHDFVLGKSLRFLNAKYVIFLDADTACPTDLSYLAGAVEREGLDLCSVKVIPSKKETITENLQYIEYEIAMKSRKIYPWLTSGAAMIGKRESLIEIMKDHSLFFNGGDIEIGKLANLKGMKVDYIPVTFYTDVPETFPKLVRQRYSWFCGAFRHSVINAHTNLFNPIYALYFTLIIFFMLPFKMWELMVHWYVVPALVAFYLVMVYILNWELRSRYMLLFPFYSLFQIIVLPVCGMIRYYNTVKDTKNFGFIKTWYKVGYSPYRYALNLIIIGAITFTVFNVHFVERTLYLSNIDLFAIVGITFIDTTWESILWNDIKLFVVMTGLFLIVIGIMSSWHYFSKKNSPSEQMEWFDRTSDTHLPPLAVQVSTRQKKVAA